ncbi:MAG: CDP-alcohol phosphatidyltransferase family protein [Thermoplasmatota archaeon]
MSLKKELLYPSNILSLSRIVFLPVLFLLLFLRWDIALAVTYAIIGSTDYWDGKLARRRNEITELGKKLDSVADVLLYLSTVYFFVVLFPQYLEPNYLLLYIFFGIFGLSFVVSLIRTKKIVLMHTSLLRLAAVGVYSAFIFSFFFDTTYYITVIAVLYIFGFIEEILIFLFYGEVDPDVRYIWLLMKNRE